MRLCQVSETLEGCQHIGIKVGLISAYMVGPVVRKMDAAHDFVWLNAQRMCPSSYDAMTQPPCVIQTLRVIRTPLWQRTDPMVGIFV